MYPHSRTSHHSMQRYSNLKSQTNKFTLQSMAYVVRILYESYFVRNLRGEVFCPQFSHI